MKQGIGFIRSQSAMEALMVLAFCMTALGVPMMTFLPVFAKDIFHQGPGMFTLFLSISGIGSIVGALTVAALGNVHHKGRIALIMLICLGAGISGFALSTSVWLSCLMLFFSGASLIAVFTLVNSLVQLITTNEMRGPRDERLQLRFPRRHADGKPVDRLARPTLFGPPRARREWSGPHGCGTVLPGGAASGRRSLM